MDAVLSTIMRLERKYLLGALAAPLLMMGHAGVADAAQDLIFGPLDLDATVQEKLVPGASIFLDDHSTPNAQPGDRSEYLYLASQGENLSGRSVKIQGAFASALAEQDGNSGVGVTSWIGANPSNSDPSAVQDLIALGVFSQNFTNTGTTPEDISAHVKIPALEVGLIGVPPQVTAINNNETASAEVDLNVTIVHSDGTTDVVGTIFSFGLNIFERQIPSGAQLFNFFDDKFLGANKNTAHLFDSFKFNGDDFNPRLTINAVSTDVDLGTLQPGDELFYNYNLKAEGTTNGGEQGFMAFLGDPFGVDVTLGNLVFTATPAPTASVPEPATWIMMMLGFGLVAGLAGRHGASALR